MDRIDFEGLEDRTAQKFMEGKAKERAEITRSIQRLARGTSNAPKWAFIGLLVLLLLGLDYYVYLSITQWGAPYLEAVAVINILILLGMVGGHLAFEASKPSVYNLLAGFAARHPDSELLERFKEKYPNLFSDDGELDRAKVALFVREYLPKA